MKKITKLFITFLALFLVNSAYSLEIVDVQSNHWAGQEIIHSIQNGYISIVDGNKFKPNSPMSRSEFVTSLLKVIGRQNENVVQRTTYKDINSKTTNARNIVLSEQIQMSYGYPNKTFSPMTYINHNETMSMIANITNGDYVAADITNFADYEDIPLWARRAYIKNVANDIYVNHPDPAKFTPANNLTRAEAAVLFDKVAQNLAKIKEQIKDLSSNTPSSDYTAKVDYDDFISKESTFIADNTLNVVDFAPNNKVKIYDNKKIIEAGNILIGTNLKLVKTRKDLVGTEYVFACPNDVYTKEGTFLFPKGTEFYARVDKIGYSNWRAKPHKSRIVFHKYSFPTGETYDMAGVPLTKNEKIKYVNSIKKSKKAYTMEYYSGKKENNIIALAHQMAPLTEFNIDKDKTIYILITGDTVIPLNDEYLNLRKKKSVLDESI